MERLIKLPIVQQRLVLQILSTLAPGPEYYSIQKKGKKDVSSAGDGGEVLEDESDEDDEDNDDDEVSNFC
jgi:hypothetical protein